MKKQIRYLLVSILVALCTVFVSGTVDSSFFGKTERSQVVFQHELHNEKAKIDACNKCHHVFDNFLEDRHCSDCHGLRDTGGISSLRKAFHLQCKGCHEKSSKGPVTCGQCHLKGNNR